MKPITPDVLQVALKWADPSQVGWSVRQEKTLRRWAVDCGVPSLEGYMTPLPTIALFILKHTIESEPPAIKVKGTQRHEFDIARVQMLIATNALGKADALRILDEALHVIGGLRHVAVSAKEVMSMANARVANLGTLWMHPEKKTRKPKPRTR